MRRLFLQSPTSPLFFSPSLILRTNNIRSKTTTEEQAERKEKAKAKWAQHDQWDENPFQEAAEYEAEPLDDPYEDLIAAHRILGTRPADPLYRVKLSYMMRCRDTHPEVDGNPATFYKIALAYERILKDRGIEMRDGKIQFSEALPKIPHGHDVMADASRQLLIKAAQEVPGVDRYERSEALERMREVRMSLAGTSEMLTNPASAPISEMKALEKLELVHDILLTPQALKGLAWFEQPFRMSVAEIEARDGGEVAAALEAIVAPPHLQLSVGGVEKDEEIAGHLDKSSAVANQDSETSNIEGNNNKAVTDIADTNKQSNNNNNNNIAVSEAIKKDPTLKNITPELLFEADEIAKKAEKEKGTLKYQTPIATLHTTQNLGPGTAVVQARQFEAIARAGKVSTYARYSQYPHPPRPLSQLPTDLDKHHNLRPEEEEAVARMIINKQLE
jgi:hypothetical protein